jgi:hypothetical protein
MNAQPRRPAASLPTQDIPTNPGVYAWYRNGKAVYVGKATSLKDRLGRHLGRGPVMTSSAFRRNVAEELGIATANDINTGVHVPTSSEVAAMRGFVDECDVTWLTTKTVAAAVALEAG